MRSLRLDIAGVTDVGLERGNNEDALLISGWKATDLLHFSCAATLNDASLPAILLATDGVGGESGGEIASRLVIEAFAAHRPDAPETVRRTAAIACGTMREFAGTIGRASRMASTLAGLSISSAGLVAFSAGDCFIGRLSGSYCQNILGSYEFGSSSSEVDAFIGTGTPESMEMLKTELLELRGGRFLILTDGVSRFVPPEVFDRLVAADATPKQAVDRVTAAVLDTGARDNFTLICADVFTDVQPSPNGKELDA